MKRATVFLTIVAANILALFLIYASVPNVAFAASPSQQTGATPLFLSTGQIVAVNTQYGTYYEYIPQTLAEWPEIVVLIHGTPAEEQTAQEVARYYIEGWLDFAETHGVIVLAPAFDEENFGAHGIPNTAPLGGYRALQGRVIGADVFVNNIVSRYQMPYGIVDGPFYLYGHSAGGQFVARYAVTHPQRIKGAVISAAGRYPFPEAEITWPYGMGPLHETALWPDTAVELNITPDPLDWLAAAQLPITVIVGLRDSEMQPDVPGQAAATRYTLANNWVHAMHNFAAEHDTASSITLTTLPGAGHSAAGLMPHAQAALLHESETAHSVASPNGRNRVTFSLVDGVAYYAISHAGQTVIEPSRLGFVLQDNDPFNENLEVVGCAYRTFDEIWTQPWGEVAQIRNHYNELRIDLAEAQGQQRRMSVVFRVYDDGVGFRYEIPEQPNLDTFQIMDEQTEFALAGDHTAWWIPGFALSRYESLYTSSPVSTMAVVHTPLTMETADGLYLSIHEAALVDYASMLLTAEGTTLACELAPWPNGVKVYAEAPLVTPWRTIQIAESPGGLITSYLILNLNEPNALGDVTWVQPGKYIGMWWGIHIDRYTWKRGPRHGATTENIMSYIDFAAAHGFNGVLAEGWNYGWDTAWWGDYVSFNFTRPYPDFDIEAITAYAAERGVTLIGHHETGGAVSAYEDALADAFAYYAGLGVNVVKTGYASRYHVEGDQWHYGQFMVRHHQLVTETAAQYQIMLDIHEPVKDTGLRRTYPNLLTREGARGMEYNAWDAAGGNPPEHTVILPFTRLLSGPMDYTPGIFDLLFEDARPYNRVNTTLAKQLAYYVVIYSPLQMAADLPENYEGHPAFRFIEAVPVNWQDTRVLNGQIGDYVTIARQDRAGDNWYLGSITDEEARTFSVPLTFLDANRQYIAEIYADAPDAHWESNPTAYMISETRVTHETVLEIWLAAGGGQAIIFRPTG